MPTPRVHRAGRRHAPQRPAEREGSRANVAIVRAFVRLRRPLAEHKDLARKLEELERTCDAYFRVVFESIRWRTAPPARVRRVRIGFHRPEGATKARRGSPSEMPRLRKERGERAPPNVLLVLAGIVAAPSCTGPSAVQRASPALPESQSATSRPDAWPALRHLPEERDRLRTRLESAAGRSVFDKEGYLLLDVDVQVSEFGEVRNETLRRDYPQCRFFEASIVSNEEWELQGRGRGGLRSRVVHGRSVFGIFEGSAEVYRAKKPSEMGDFLRKGGTRIPSAESLGALLDRCCFGREKTEDGAAKVTRDGSSFLVESHGERWRFRTDAEGRVLGVARES